MNFPRSSDFSRTKTRNGNHQSAISEQQPPAREEVVPVFFICQIISENVRHMAYVCEACGNREQKTKHQLGAVGEKA